MTVADSPKQHEEIHGFENYPALIKADLVALVFERVTQDYKAAYTLVEGLFTEIADALVRGETVRLSGFGVFHPKDKVARPGRNPRTGAAVPISARRVVTFVASAKLKALRQRALIDWAARDKPGTRSNPSKVLYLSGMPASRGPVGLTGDAPPPGSRVS